MMREGLEPRENLPSHLGGLTLLAAIPHHIFYYFNRLPFSVAWYQPCSLEGQVWGAPGGAGAGSPVGT